MILIYHKINTTPMKVLNENSNTVTIEFDKHDFNEIRNFFITRPEEEIYNLCSSPGQFEAIKKLVHLEDVDKGLFEEIFRFLDKDKDSE